MNYRRVFLPIVFLLFSAALWGQSQSIQLPGSPVTLESFLEYRDQVADTPEGGAAVLLQALLLYAEDQTLGHDAMVIALDRCRLRENEEGYRGFSPAGDVEDYLERYIMSRPYIARSYVVGTSPQTQYELPQDREISVSRNSSSEIAPDRVKVFIASSGADSPRPVTLIRNNRGVWKASELSSLFVGVRPPEEVVDDDI